MNRRLAFSGAFATVLMISVMAYGQRQGQGRGRGMMGRGMSTARLLGTEAVRKEIGVTAEQAAKLRELQTANRQAFGNFREMSEEEREKALAKRAKVAEEQQQKIAEILDDKQEKRLNEIRIQAMGALALMDEEIAKKLGISDEQKEKMATVRNDMRQKMRNAMSGGDRPDREAMRKMLEELGAVIKKVLTEEQTAKFEKMKGKPFDMPQRRGDRRSN